MQLGAFSISLAVKNIEASKVFYENFGFEVVGGDPSQNWLILRNCRPHNRPLPGNVRKQHPHL